MRSTRSTGHAEAWEDSSEACDVDAVNSKSGLFCYSCGRQGHIAAKFAATAPTKGKGKDGGKGGKSRRQGRPQQGERAKEEWDGFCSYYGKKGHGPRGQRACLGRQARSWLTPAIWLHGLLTNAVLLQDRSRQSKEGARRLPRGYAFSRSSHCHTQSQAALQGAINISLLCPTILWHWRELFLFIMGQVSMFPRCCCCVLWEEIATPSRALPSIDFDSGQRSTKGACHPFIVEKLMEDGQGLSAAWSTHSDLPHRSRQGCNFLLTKRQKSSRDILPQELNNSSI